jgi:hypothetical protein
VVALGNLGAATTLNASQGTVYTATLDQSSTLTLGTTNGTANRATSFTLILTNGAGGPFTLTLAGGTFKYSDGTISRTTTDAPSMFGFSSHQMAEPRFLFLSQLRTLLPKEY